MLAPPAARTPAAGSPVATQRTRSVAQLLLVQPGSGYSSAALSRSTETVPTARAAIQRQVRTATGTTTPPGLGRFRTRVRRQAELALWLLGKFLFPFAVLDVFVWVVLFPFAVLDVRMGRPLSVRRSRRLRMGRPPIVRRSRRLRRGRPSDGRRSRRMDRLSVLRSGATDRGEPNASWLTPPADQLQR